MPEHTTGQDSISQQRAKTEAATASAKRATSDGTSKLSESSQQVAQSAKHAAQEAGAAVTSHVRDMLDQQVGSGAEMVRHLAGSAKTAARDLDQNAPQIAGLVHGLAQKIDSVADSMEGQSAEQLVGAVSGFVRRQPAVTFGLAALAGFFVLRTVKSASHASSTRPAPSSPSPYGAASRGTGAGEFHGHRAY